jgi:hypothetical protein
MTRLLRTIALAACAAAFVSANAHAESLDAKQWRFTLVFPCQSQLGSQVVNTAVGDILLTSYVCGGDNDAYFAAISDYPAGTVTPEKLDLIYAGAVNGQAENTKGTIRTVAPYTLGNTTGREAFIDIAEPKGAIRLRLFLVGDRLYQVMCIEPAGDETGQKCLDFLNSFTLLP